MIKLLRSPLFWIICLAAFLRLYQLGSIPPGFFRDEAAKGYNAYCLLKTGKDIDNQLLPIFTREFTVHNSALATYLIVPSLFVFGLTEFATRLPFALAGILTVISTYLLVARIFSQRTAYLAAFLLAISPWHILFSRWANQGILLPLFITAGLYCWIRAIKTKEIKTNRWLIAGFMIIAGSLYTYDIAKVFILLLLLGLLIIYLREIRQTRRSFVLGLCGFHLMLIPLIWFSITAPTLVQERFNRISIFGLDTSFWNIGIIFIKNYLAHFSPLFLFITGDNNLRHSVGAMGLIYLFELPFIIYGIYLLIKEKKKENKVLLWWLLIFPVAASLTNEGIPHALRTICALPVFSIIAAIGIEKTLQIIPKYSVHPVRNGISNGVQSLKYRVYRLIIMIAIVANISYFIINLFYAYPIYSGSAWQYGWKSAVEYLDTVKSDYSEIVVSPSFGYPHSFILFYDKVNPHSWQGPNYATASSGKNEWNIPPYRFDIPDNYIINELQYSVDSSILFVLPSSQYMNVPVRSWINYPDGQKAIVFLSK